MTSTSPVLVQPSALLATDSALIFSRVTPGTPRFLVLTLDERYADTPVVLTTDQDCFQLASDEHPRFSSRLALTPASGVTFVHLRYAPARSGQHRGCLHLETPHETRVLSLRGQASGMVPRAGLWIEHRWAGLMALVLGGLALAGYTYRSQILPGWGGGSTTLVSTEVPLPLSTPNVRRTAPEVVPKSARPRAVPTGGTERLRNRRLKQIASQPSPEEVLAEEHVSMETDSRAGPQEPVLNPSRPESSERRPARVSGANQSRQPATAPVPPSGESELERELNHKPNQ